MLPHTGNYVNFTSTSGNVICQRCKVSFPKEVELHFLHDATGEGPGKRVCDECRQYYITKTEKVRQSGKLLFDPYSTVILIGARTTSTFQFEPGCTGAAVN